MRDLDPEQDLDGDGAPAHVDCQDGNPAVGPEMPEVCNGVDDDCNGTVDDTLSDCPPSPTPASPTPASPTPASPTPASPTPASPTPVTCPDVTPPPVDHDNDGYPLVDDDGYLLDCDDEDPSIHPAAIERCNGLDDDCDGSIDPEYDQDQDGALDIASCDTLGAGSLGTDCDDTRADIWPGAVELCDGIDNNCNALADEAQDLDSDGYLSCDPRLFDCNDLIPTIHPGAIETCDGQDNDCDGMADDGLEPASCPAVKEQCNGVDDDRDGLVDEGYDQDGDGSLRCSVDGMPADCDDQSAGTRPGLPERCDGVDNDCNGNIDDNPADTLTAYADGDRDGYGDVGQPRAVCTLSDGLVLLAGDCADNDASINPAIPESCDGIDNDCDGGIDEGLRFDLYFQDIDKDGFGGAGTYLCKAPANAVSRGGDCDDKDASINPGALECPDTDGDGLPNLDKKDNNCNTLIDEGC